MGLFLEFLTRVMCYPVVGIDIKTSISFLKGHGKSNSILFFLFDSLLNHKKIVSTFFEFQGFFWLLLLVRDFDEIRMNDFNIFDTNIVMPSFCITIIILVEAECLLDNGLKLRKCSLHLNQLIYLWYEYSNKILSKMTIILWDLYIFILMIVYLVTESFNETSSFSHKISFLWILISIILTLFRLFISSIFCVIKIPLKKPDVILLQIVISFLFWTCN